MGQSGSRANEVWNDMKALLDQDLSKIKNTNS